ncbi:MAG TPA: nucleotide exchange factor GrpE [Spirochaetia bacterium]|nr:nucleotide exchange factor GrpE [Spirochaetia bacterium]
MSDQNENREETVPSEQEAMKDSHNDPGTRSDEVLSAQSAQDAPAEVDGQDSAGEVAVESVEDELFELRKRVGELSEENSTLKDQYLRKSADFENFRKRMHREKEESVTFANRQLLLDIVPIIDDFERAIKSAEDSQDFTAFHDGIVLIEHQFTGMLERKWGLKRFESVGEEFDPSKHEAVTTEEVPAQETSVVLEDYQKGYLLHEKILRSAKVKVSVSSASNNR